MKKIIQKFASITSLLIFTTSVFCFLNTRENLQKRSAIKINMHFEEALLGNTALTTDNLLSERYIATNRFKVRNNSGPKFEKRWADRKSRLASLPGFRFFTLLKQVDINNHGEHVIPNTLGNYISLTVWEDKDSFDSWRTGDAFKEAHGGGGIGDFIQLLTTAIFILDGAPKPAFYDGLLPTTNLNTKIKEAEMEGGWRKVSADGERFIKPDLFVCQQRFNIPKEHMVSFEKEWREIETQTNEKLKVLSGFMSGYLMRRDAAKADDNWNYIFTTNWENKESYQQFLRAQDSPVSSLVSAFSNGIKGFTPIPHYFEGKLAIQSSKGA